MELTNLLELGLAPQASVEVVQTNLNIVWTMIAAFLVFFMQAGFAMVEAGFIRAKNTGNVLMKNLLDFSMGAIAYWVLGFGLMFGESAGGFIGTTGFLFQGAGEWTYTFFMFQLVFAATAATIVSGAMAGRTKFSAYLIYSFVVSLVIYPISGHWAWGSLYGVPDAVTGIVDSSKGWLEAMGYLDFAGSGVVHMIGGVLGLVGAIFLKPRLGKYRKDGKAVPIPGHNLPLAALGVFILWFGWYGFNPGSTTTGTPDIGYIAMTTTLAAAAGVIGALVTSWITLKVPDIGMTLNGALAGLVAITAGTNAVSPGAAALIGLIGGILVVLSVLFVDRVLKIDDPVGAFSVHGVNGAWGVLAVGIFVKDASLGTQALGVAALAGWAALAGIVLFGILKVTHGLRVTKEEELLGLDLGEHKADAYPEFRKDFTKA